MIDKSDKVLEENIAKNCDQQTSFSHSNQKPHQMPLGSKDCRKNVEKEKPPGPKESRKRKSSELISKASSFAKQQKIDLKDKGNIFSL